MLPKTAILTGSHLATVFSIPYCTALVNTFFKKFAGIFAENGRLVQIFLVKPLDKAAWSCYNTEASHKKRWRDILLLAE